MTRLFRSLLVLLALLAFSTGGMWDVASAHPAKIHAVTTQAPAAGHHHAIADAHRVTADHSADHAHHQPPQQAADLQSCLDIGKPCGSGDSPEHTGSLCCAAMACHMAVVPQTVLTTSAVAIRAVNPLPLETTVEGTLGPRLERPPRSFAG